MVYPKESISDKNHIPQHHQPVSKRINVFWNQLHMPGSISPLFCFGRYKWWFSLVRRESDWVCTHLCVHYVSPPGHGFCSCGRCICSDGWFGKHCQFPRSCEMTDEQSKSLCETADGVICSGKGSCHCGRCICSPQEWYISGEFCECDDRDCDKHDGLVCTGNGVCNCGNCDCWDGWTGNACEIWVREEF